MKILEMIERKASKSEILATICDQVEDKGDIGKCILLEQSKLILEGGDGRRHKMFIPLDADTVYAQSLAAQKPQIFNDFRHDRSILKSLKAYLEEKKVFNVMFIPLQTNLNPDSTKMLVLVNQFKPKPPNAGPTYAGVPTPFTLYSQLCMNKLFQNTLLNALNLADLQK